MSKKIIVPFGNKSPTNLYLLSILEHKVGDNFTVNNYLKDECTQADCETIYSEIKSIEEINEDIVFITLPDKSSFKKLDVQTISSFLESLKTA